MHPKVSVFFLNICPKRAYLEIKIKIKFDHSFVSSCLHLLFSPEKTPKNIIPIFLCHGVMDPCTFLLEHLFYLSHRKTRWTMSINNVGLKICLLRTSNSMVTLTFFSLGVNQSGPRTSSTTNHKFYNTLGRLHGPWCKQPLSIMLVKVAPSSINVW